MATFKAEVLSHHKKMDGTYNVKIRVTHNRRKKYLATPYYVSKDDLTRSLKIKNQRIIDATDDIIRKYRERCNSKGYILKNISVDELVDYILSPDEENFKLNIFQYARDHVKMLENDGRKETANGYRSAINSLERFIGSDQLDINMIDVKLINSWIDFIKKDAKKGFSGNKVQFLYPFCLRYIYNKAKKEFNDEDRQIIRIPYSPFDKVELKYYNSIRQRGLSAEDTARLFSYIPDDKNEIFSLDMFKLSFFLIGMNAIDLYKCTDFRDGRITYMRSKTRTKRNDMAEISVKIESEMEDLFNRYKDPTGERVFRFHLDFSNPETFRNRIYYGIVKLRKSLGIESLDFYTARHTWATIASNEAGVDKFTVHEALNHSIKSMQITDVYIRKSYKKIDEANRKVIDYLLLLLKNMEP